MITNKFVDKFMVYLKEIVTTGTYTKDYNMLCGIKSYMHAHPNNVDVIAARKSLAQCLCNVYESKDLLDSINEPHKYLRALKIFTNDPRVKHQALIDLFSITIFIPEGSYMENNISWFIEDTGLKVPSTLNYLRNFRDENRYPSKDNTYGTLEQEIIRYTNMKNNIVADDYEEFVKDKKLTSESYNKYYEGNPYFDYLHKKLGNIGELHLEKELRKSSFNALLVARDLGNGLGYDIYTQTTNIENPKEITEVLIEVKSTSVLDSDTFSITDGELKVMKDTIGDNKASYIVALSRIDVTKNIYNITFFKAIGENTFTCMDNNEEYIFSHTDRYGNHVFENKKNIKTK